MGTDDTGIAHVIEGDIVKIPSEREEIDFPGDEWFYAISFLVAWNYNGHRYTLDGFCAQGFNKEESQQWAQDKADEINAEQRSPESWLSPTICQPSNADTWTREPSLQERMQNEYMREQSDRFEDW